MSPLNAGEHEGPAHFRVTFSHHDDKILGSWDWAIALDAPRRIRVRSAITVLVDRAVIISRASGILPLVLSLLGTRSLKRMMWRSISWGHIMVFMKFPGYSLSIVWRVIQSTTAGHPARGIS